MQQSPDANNNQDNSLASWGTYKQNTQQIEVVPSTPVEQGPKRFLAPRSFATARQIYQVNYKKSQQCNNRGSMKLTKILSNLTRAVSRENGQSGESAKGPQPIKTDQPDTAITRGRTQFHRIHHLLQKPFIQLFVITTETKVLANCKPESYFLHQGLLKN